MKGRWLIILPLIALVALLISCAPPGAPAGGGGAAATGPIKVGLLQPVTGTSAASGKDVVDGWNLYWELKGTKVAGREVQTLLEDEGNADPTLAVNKARALVEQQKVNFIVGPLFANDVLAVSDYAASVGQLMIPAFLEVNRKPEVLGVAGWNTSQPHHPLGEYVFDLGKKKVLTLCTDYAFGHDVCGGFVDTFTRKGGTIIKQLWNPIGTPDYSSYITQIKESGADAVFVLAVGADSVRFAKQWAEFGMKDKMPLYGGEVLLDQSLLRSMGPEAEGLISAGHYSEGRPAKATQDFVDAYLKKYQLLPSYYSVTGYVTAQWLAEMIAAQKGNVEDKQAFMDAAKKFKLADSPMGPRELDQYGNPISEVYIRQVQKRADGKLWNVPIKTYEKVTAAGSIPLDEFMKQPAYSRTFQGSKFKPQ